MSRNEDSAFPLRQCAESVRCHRVGEVLITPDGEYALVVDAQSGSVAVVRIPTVLDHKVKTKPLFTVFPTATGARSATIVPFPAGARA